MNSHKTILALDVGTTTGWAGMLEGEIYSGKAKLKTSKETKATRYLGFEELLKALDKLTKCSVDTVYYEHVRAHSGVDAAHVYGGFEAILTMYFAIAKVKLEPVPVGTIKKHATGKGNASKQEMIEAMKAKGHNPSDDNEADALALLHYAIDIEEINI